MHCFTLHRWSISEPADHSVTPPHTHSPLCVCLCVCVSLLPGHPSQQTITLAIRNPARYLLKCNIAVRRKCVRIGWWNSTCITLHTCILLCNMHTLTRSHTSCSTQQPSLETEWYLAVFISRQPQVCICLFMQPMKASETSQYYTGIKKCVFDTSLNIYYDAPITKGFVTCDEAILFHQSPKKKRQRGGNVYSAHIFTVVFNNCNQYN